MVGHQCINETLVDFVNINFAKLLLDSCYVLNVSIEAFYIFMTRSMRISNNYILTGLYWAKRKNFSHQTLTDNPAPHPQRHIPCTAHRHFILTWFGSVPHVDTLHLGLFADHCRLGVWV